jgi:hypothetical protein
MVRVAFDSVSNLPNMLAPVIEHLLVEGVNPTTAKGAASAFSTGMRCLSEIFDQSEGVKQSTVAKKRHVTVCLAKGGKAEDM